MGKPREKQSLAVRGSEVKGLPVGLMLIGRHFEDSTILRIAQAYEQSFDWQKA